MKRVFLFSISIILIIISTSSCKNKLPENTYLGVLPALADKYQSQIEELEKKADKETNMEKAFEYTATAENLEQEARLSITEEWEKMEKPISIPFEQQVYTDHYIIKKVSIVDANYNLIKIEGTAEIKMKKARHFAYLRGIDSKGREIPGWAVLMSYHNPLIGKQEIMKGSYNNIRNLADLQKFRAMSREYFNENQNN